MSTSHSACFRRRALPALLLLALLALPCSAVPAWCADDWTGLFPSSGTLDTGALSLQEVTVDAPAAGGTWRVTLPKGSWQSLPVQELEPGTQRLAGFVWPLGEGEAQVEVLTHRLGSEVAAADWLLALLVRAGATVLTTRPDTGAAGEVFEALAQLPARPGQPWRLLARLSVQRRGQSIVMVRCLAPSRQFASLAQAFAATTLGWRAPGQAKEDLVGDWPETCLPGGLCLRGPGLPAQVEGQAAWDLAQGGPVTGRLRAEVNQDAGQAPSSSEARVQALLRLLAKDGLDLSWSLSGLSVTPPRLAGTACLYRGKAWRQGRDAELWALVWSDGRHQLCLWLVSVGQMSNMAAWMQNKRAFELAMRSLRQGPER